MERYVVEKREAFHGGRELAMPAERQTISVDRELETPGQFTCA
jgi:hypothetical protein